MWFEALQGNQSWTRLISDYVMCGCGGIRTVEESCQACGGAPYDTATVWETISLPLGGEVEIPANVYCGAEGRYEDYQLLSLMEREWNRPVAVSPSTSPLGRMSERATVVILFWTYFESRMYRLVELGAQGLPDAVRTDLFDRYDSVTSHMRQLYQILYGTRYADDLAAVGAESVAGHLARIQSARNRFVHGDPNALSDELVKSVVSYLKTEHEAWIAVFNRRVAAMTRPPSTRPAR